ncbi:hypothetical protein [Caulobacter sp. NIBR2454]|uniref:hypothetical protein n=1 Tax=Caulobacter sp. NIBR2454 TaxID=3015996 RepID=UPI0022B627AD|nr:hypothetical protein [Caulobacter sp. NIBR2454]
MNRLTGAILALSLAAAAPALANEEVIATRPPELPADAPAARPATEPVFKPMTTSEQIAGYLASSPDAVDETSPDAMLRRDLSRYLSPTSKTRMDRQMHGEVTAMIGTGGARGAWGTVALPVGETGVVTLSGGQSRNLYRGYPGYPGYYGGWRGGPYGEDLYERSFGLEFMSDAPIP